MSDYGTSEPDHNPYTSPSAHNNENLEDQDVSSPEPQMQPRIKKRKSKITNIWSSIRENRGVKKYRRSEKIQPRRKNEGDTENMGVKSKPEVRDAKTRNKYLRNKFRTELFQSSTNDQTNTGEISQQNRIEKLKGITSANSFQKKNCKVKRKRQNCRGQFRHKDIPVFKLGSNDATNKKKEAIKRIYKRIDLKSIKSTHQIEVKKICPESQEMCKESDVEANKDISGTAFSEITKSSPVSNPCKSVCKKRVSSKSNTNVKVNNDQEISVTTATKPTNENETPFSIFTDEYLKRKKKLKALERQSQQSDIHSVNDQSHTRDVKKGMHYLPCTILERRSSKAEPLVTSQDTRLQCQPIQTSQKNQLADEQVTDLAQPPPSQQIINKEKQYNISIVSEQGAGEHTALSDDSAILNLSTKNSHNKKAEVIATNIQMPIADLYSHRKTSIGNENFGQSHFPKEPLKRRRYSVENNSNKIKRIESDSSPYYPAQQNIQTPPCITFPLVPESSLYIQMNTPPLQGKITNEKSVQYVPQVIQQNSISSKQSYNNLSRSGSRPVRKENSNDIYYLKNLYTEKSLYSNQQECINSLLRTQTNNITTNTVSETKSNIMEFSPRPSISQAQSKGSTLTNTILETVPILSVYGDRRYQNRNSSHLESLSRNKYIGRQRESNLSIHKKYRSDKIFGSSTCSSVQAIIKEDTPEAHSLLRNTVIPQPRITESKNKKKVGAPRNNKVDNNANKDTTTVKVSDQRETSATNVKQNLVEKQVSVGSKEGTCKQTKPSLFKPYLDLRKKCIKNKNHSRDTEAIVTSNLHPSAMKEAYHGTVLKKDSSQSGRETVMSKSNSISTYEEKLRKIVHVTEIMIKNVDIIPLGKVQELLQCISNKSSNSQKNEPIDDEIIVVDDDSQNATLIKNEVVDQQPSTVEKDIHKLKEVSYVPEDISSLKEKEKVADEPGCSSESTSLHMPEPNFSENVTSRQVSVIAKLDMQNYTNPVDRSSSEQSVISSNKIENANNIFHSGHFLKHKDKMRLRYEQIKSKESEYTVNARGLRTSVESENKSQETDSNRSQNEGYENISEDTCTASEGGDNIHSSSSPNYLEHNTSTTLSPQKYKDFYGVRTICKNGTFAETYSPTESIAETTNYSQISDSYRNTTICPNSCQSKTTEKTKGPISNSERSACEKQVNNEAESEIFHFSLPSLDNAENTSNVPKNPVINQNQIHASETKNTITTKVSRIGFQPENIYFNARESYPPEMPIEQVPKRIRVIDAHLLNSRENISHDFPYKSELNITVKPPNADSIEVKSAHLNLDNPNIALRRPLVIVHNEKKPVSTETVPTNSSTSNDSNQSNDNHSSHSRNKNTRQYSHKSISSSDSLNRSITNNNNRLAEFDNIESMAQSSDNSPGNPPMQNPLIYSVNSILTGSTDYKSKTAALSQCIDLTKDDNKPVKVQKRFRVKPKVLENLRKGINKNTMEEYKKLQELCAKTDAINNTVSLYNHYQSLIAALTREKNNMYYFNVRTSAREPLESEETLFYVFSQMSPNNILSPEQYVEEIKYLQRYCPSDFREFYIYLTKRLIKNGQLPISFKVFLEFHNSGRIKQFHNSFRQYLQKCAKK